MTEPEDVAAHPSPGRNVVAVAVAQFAGLGLAALIIVALATSVASRRVGEREAVANARTVTVLKAR